MKAASRIRCGFKSTNQTPFFMIWREDIVDGEVVFAEVVSQIWETPSLFDFRVEHKPVDRFMANELSVLIGRDIPFHKISHHLFLEIEGYDEILAWNNTRIVARKGNEYFYIKEI